MGNKKKIGSRNSCYKVRKGGGKFKAREHSTPSPVSTTSQTSSRSKEKLGKNFSYYESKKENLEYQILDLGQFETTLREVAVCRLCHSYLKLSTKTLVGLATEITISCTVCDQSNKSFINCDKVCMPEINNEIGLKQDQTFYDLNLRLVYGLRTVGKGETPAQSICGILNLPAPPSKFKKHEAFLGRICEDLCKQQMKIAVEEAVNETEDPGSRKLCVAVDGSWQRRGHVSLNGIVSVTSVDTGKVLDVHVLSKYCLCPDKNNKVHLDSCKANYVGTSGGMEVDGALNIFHRSTLLYNVKYTEYLGDGDTSAFLTVSNSMPYGPDEVIKKLECVGHIQKRMGTRLRKLKEKKRGVELADGKKLGGKNRLTDAAIQKLQIFYGLAIRRNTKSVEDMRTAVWAIYFHVQSTNAKPTHNLCPKDEDTWCKFNQSLRTKEHYDHQKHFHLPEAVMLEMKPIFRDLSETSLLEKCLSGKSQNPNESLNNVIWARISKRTFVSIETLKFGTFEAVSTYNEGYVTKIKIMEHLGLPAGSYMVKAMKRLDIARVRKAEKAALDLEKKIRQARSLGKRKLEDLYEDEEDQDNPSYSSGHY